MASRILSQRILGTLRLPLNAAGSHSEASRIGNREIVGFGINGQANYFDKNDLPCPAIRFKEDTPDIKAIRNKEKGDWRQLSKEEKKTLYRASFCQTFAEFQAPTGEWKGVVGWALIGISVACWIYMGIKTFAFHPLPDSFKEENRKAQLKRMLDLRVNPVDGLSSKWDYENNRWK